MRKNNLKRYQQKQRVRKVAGDSGSYSIIAFVVIVVLLGLLFVVELFL